MTDAKKPPELGTVTSTVKAEVARLLAEHIEDGCSLLVCDPPKGDDLPANGQHPFHRHLADVLEGAHLLAGEPAIDVAHLERQDAFQSRTFPEQRTAGVLDHIRRELGEIEDNPDDIVEWADVLILAFGGAMRRGFSPAQIINAIRTKQARNEQRTWPDWRTVDPDKAIEHDRTHDDDLAEADTTEAQFDALWAEGTAATIDGVPA